MKLSDLKKFAARKRANITFRLPNNMECVVDHQGLAKIPQLKGVPEFSLDDGLEASQSFTVRYAGSERSQSMPRVELEKLISSLVGGAPQSADHEE